MGVGVLCSKPMTIERSQVEYLARLARISLKEEEIETYRVHLASILALVETLEEVDVSGIEETAHVQNLQNITRSDVVVQSRDKEDILANAPDRKGDMFAVHRVI